MALKSYGVRVHSLDALHQREDVPNIRHRGCGEHDVEPVARALAAGLDELEVPTASRLTTTLLVFVAFLSPIAW